MRHLKYLTLLAFLALPLAACDDDEGTVAPVEGSVRGTVTIEGQPAQGVTVELRGAATRTTTTNANGAYEFTAVEAGAYQVDIAGFPADAAFGATSRAAVITTAGQQVTVDFSGQFIRTSSIVVSVSAGGQALAGVTVSLTGAGSASGATNAAGVYTATGLRAGTYTVAISGYPADVTFANAAQNITVGVGQTAQVGFVGNRPSVSTVAIAGIVSQGTGLPVNPTAVAGVIAVTLAVDPGNDTPQLLEAFLNGDKIYTQTFTQAALEAMAEEAGAEDAPFNVTFSVNTAEFVPATGAVRFPNGTYVVSARFVTVQGGQTGAAQTQTDLTFANQDLVLVNLESGRTALDEGGLFWRGQGLTATYVHVAYSGLAATNFSSSFAGFGRTTNPAVWPATSTAPAINLAGVNTGPAGSNLTVSAIAGGNVVATNTVSIRYDQQNPRLGTADALANDFRIIGQDLNSTRRCCSNNWVNPAYTWSTGAPSTSDVVGGVAGVGGIVVTYHQGAASLTDTQLRALDPAGTPGEAGLAPSAVNTTYSVLAKAEDRLGNFTVQRLQGVGINPLQTFGHDAEAPTGQAVTLASVQDRTIYNANVGAPFAAGTIALTATDNAAGFGVNPVATRFRFRNSATDPVGLAHCLVGSPQSATSTCGTAVQRPLSFSTTNASGEGYYRYDGQVYDQAGLGTGTTSVVTYLFDETAPTVDNILGTAGTFVAGQSYTFSAVARDNVDLGEAQFSLVFDGLGLGNLNAIPLAGPQTLGTGWNFDAPLFQATATGTVPFITGVETTAAGAPTGTLAPVSWARFVVRDIAGNESTQQNNFVVGSYPAPVSFTAAFPGGATFQQVTAAQDLCLNAANDCAAPAVRTATITATATGASGTFQNPFNFVLFAYVDASVAPASHRFIAIDNTATVTDDGVTRTWTWSVTLPASALPAATPVGGLGVQAIGVNSANGTGLLAATDTNINVIAN